MLNISTQNSNFTPWVRYNAKAGRWYIKGDSGEQVEIQNPTFVADFENIKTGWLLFLEGQAPSQVWDINLQTPASKPSDKHKRGFALNLYSQQSFGGVVELSSSSMHLCNAINELYVQYDTAKGANPGALPVVKFLSATPMKDNKGMNYKPEFKIEKWVARPKELETTYEQSVTTSAPVQQQAPAAPVSTGVSEF